MSHKETYENKLIRMRKFINAIFTGDHKNYDYISMSKNQAYDELMMTKSINSYIKNNKIKDATYIEFLTPFKKVIALADKEGEKDLFDDVVSRISLDGKRPVFQDTTLGPTELLDAIYDEIKRRKGIL